MIGDVSTAFWNHGIGEINNIASTISKYSSRLSYSLDYGSIIYDIAKTSSFNIDSQREFFEISMGNIGANIMGTGLGLMSTGFATELGPYGMWYSGLLGVTYGRILGREMGRTMGRFIFNSIYIPFIYEPILRINMIKQQLQNEIDYNKSFVPDYWAIPY